MAKLKEIEERAEIARQHIAEQLRPLMHPASYEEMLLTVLKLLKTAWVTICSKVRFYKMS